MQGLQHSSYILVQDRLSTGGSFILCDANGRGFPMRYASQGFVELFGHNAAECMGMKCGDLVTNNFDMEKIAGLANGLTMEQVHQSSSFVKQHAGEQCQAMMANPHGAQGFSLVLNRTKDNEYLVIELVMFVHMHPAFGWAYTVGIQTDITPEVPVGLLLQLAQDRTSYETFLQGREELLQQRLGHLALGDDTTMQYLHEKAGDMWRYMMQGVTSTKPDSSATAGTTNLSDLVSAASHSDTGSESSSDSSSGTTSNADSFVNEAHFCRSLGGIWRGTVDKVMGGYDQEFNFFADGSTIQVEIMGHRVLGQYVLDCDKSPMHFDIKLPGSLNAPPPPAVPYIIHLVGDELHLCCSVTADARPHAFDGAGYIIMCRPKVMEAVIESESAELDDEKEADGVVEDATAFNIATQAMYEQPVDASPGAGQSVSQKGLACAIGSFVLSFTVVSLMVRRRWQL